MKNNFLNFGSDKKVKLPKLQLILYKNKKHAIGSIKHFYNVNHKLTLGEVDTLDITIPQYINVDTEFVKNPLFNEFKHRYFVKLKFNHIEQIYYITNVQNNSKENNSKTIHLESTVSILRDIDLYNYNITAFTIKEICEGNIFKSKDGILKDTSWKLGHIDESLLEKRRGIELNGQSNVLDAIYQIAKKFNAIIKWDTVKETVNFYDEEEYGDDRGLVFQYNRYLESLDEEYNSDELCTILKVKGKDGVSINSVSPTGQSYIMDYSYFIYPFKRDKNKNVISHSDYFDDELCNALLDYDEVINENKGKLAEVIKKKSVYDESLTIKEMQLNDLKGEVESLESVLNIAQTNNRNTKKIIKERNKKRKQFEQKEKQVDFLKCKIKQIDNEINSLKFLLSEEKNFTPSQIAFLKDYKKSRTYENNNIIDSKELIMAAQEEFRKLRMPKQIIKISIIDFFNVIDAQQDWEKFNVGDIVTINYHRFNLDKVKARIDNISINYESKDIQLEITTLSYNDENKKIAQMLYNASSIPSIVSENRYDIEKLKSHIDELNDLTKEARNAIKNPIVSGSNELTMINHLGLTSWDKDKKKMGVRINNGSFQITNNGEDYFSNYIDGDGIHADFIVGKIDNDKVDIDLGSLTDENGNGVGDLIQSESDLIIDELNREVDELFNQIDDMEKDFIIRTEELLDEMDVIGKDLEEKADELHNGIEDIGKDLDNVANDIKRNVDELVGDFGTFKTETELGSKIASEKFETYTRQTDKSLSTLAEDMEGNMSLIHQEFDKISSLVQDENGKSIIEQHSNEINSLIRDIEGNTNLIRRTEKDMFSLIEEKDSKVRTLISQEIDRIASFVQDENGESIIEQHSNKINSLVKDVSGNSSLIQQTNDKITSTVKESDKRFTTIEESAKGIERRIVDNEENISSYKVELANLNANVIKSEEFETKIVQSKNIIALQAQSDDNRSRISVNERAINLCVDDLDGAKSDIKVLKKEITSTVKEGKVESIIRQSPSAVEYAFNRIAGESVVKIDKDGLKLGSKCEIQCNSLKSTYQSDAIIKLFDNLAIDGTGRDLRMKYDNYRYLMVSSQGIAMYCYPDRDTWTHSFKDNEVKMFGGSLQFTPTSILINGKSVMTSGGDTVIYATFG